MQRLLAQAVAGEDQLSFRLVVDGESEHAAQLLDAVGAHVFVEMNDDFGVAVGLEAMALFFELGAEFEEVVNLAVENGPCAAVFVENRLMASGEVDDAESAHAETGAVGDVESLVVGAAVDDLLAHMVHECFGDIALASCANDSSDSTHGLYYYPFTTTGTELAFSADRGRLARRLKR